jgi:hypothetical protein
MSRMTGSPYVNLKRRFVEMTLDESSLRYKEAGFVVTSDGFLAAKQLPNVRWRSAVRRRSRY